MMLVIHPGKASVAARHCLGKILGHGISKHSQKSSVRDKSSCEHLSQETPQGLEGPGAWTGILSDAPVAQNGAGAPCSCMMLKCADGSAPCCFCCSRSRGLETQRTCCNHAAWHLRSADIEEEKRFAYTTPKSFLELIKLYSGMLGKQAMARLGATGCAANGSCALCRSSRLRTRRRGCPAASSSSEPRRRRRLCTHGRKS